jgi:hypothetical protein
MKKELGFGMIVPCAVYVLYCSTCYYEYESSLITYMILNPFHHGDLSRSLPRVSELFQRKVKLSRLWIPPIVTVLL